MGRRDLTDCEAITDFLAGCRGVIEGGSRGLSIDLREVRQADSKLVACLVAVFRLADAAGVRLEVLPSAAIADLLELHRLQGLLQR